MRVGSAAAVIVTVTLGATLVAHGSSERTDGQKSKQLQVHSNKRDRAARSGSIETHLKSLSVLNARLESAPPIDHTSSVRLKFDISNDSDERAEDLVVEVVLVSPPDDRATSPPVVVVALRSKSWTAGSRRCPDAAHRMPA
jgi:hypothetical protein